MKFISYEKRMEIVQQYLYWAYSRGVDKLGDLSVLLIERGYDPNYIMILENAAKRLYFKYLME